MLESALASGLAAAGADVFLGGVLPTPAAAILVRRHRFDLGAVVSASHNPWQDNGIKFFGRNGRKLNDEAERRVEERVAAGPATGSASGRIRKLEGALDDYLRELGTAFQPRPERPARSSSTAPTAPPTAPPPPSSSGSAPTLVTVGNEPDGRNINEGCGSTYLEQRRRRGRRARAPRSASPSTATATGCSPSTRTGGSFDGDEIVALAALHLKEAGELPGGAAVTVMSNYGFHQAMEAAGIDVATTKVGDRYVIEELVERGWTIGGEQSGHIIWTDFAATGDGLAAALLVMQALGDAHAGRRRARSRSCRSGSRTSAFRAARRSTTPPGSGRRSAARAPASRAAAACWSDRRAPSRCVRVMVEAPDEAECEEVLGRLVAVAREALG